ncbi:HAMP domain-containing sensor histidine kinase [Novosphingobium resinovorum]|uniref:histidine kinase n=1 Tax=Novosphingobium resinovorum TaxID=158500 RepID=A0A031JQR9_9SPHN|nr:MULTISPECIES: HAMP domain-containing sensor histidine kinase [Sphingomonadaceae]EJU12898.1 signal transduction histidine kinase [Sphingomonas sp. LH128]EZP76608.1 Signal transduction histidine kinase [Novosphingobium resinovorum]MBF7013959.1 HAMP domain-containing histidine kinase [Novosphingobium sp. HR1a]WJM26102.1 HAMP domain-containing sensor histidine kinase [Novosphingobium resinovorum]
MNLASLLPRRGRRAPWRSTAGRFLLLYMALCFACTVPALLYVYFETDRILLSNFQRPLEHEQGHLLSHYNRGGIPNLSKAVADRAGPEYKDDTAILLVDARGRKLAGNIVAWPRGVRAPAQWQTSLLHRLGRVRGEEFLVLTTRYPTGEQLLLGGLLDNRIQMQLALLRGLAGALALAIPIGLLGSIVLVREMNRMVETISRVGEHVGAGDLRRRAETDGSGDPVDRLKASLNAMLDRIEALVEEHRTLTDALAHDLRSPLTRIHIQVTEALAASPDPASHARFEAIAHEVGIVLHMLESALEISRAEAGVGRGTFERFDLGAMLADLREIYQPLACAGGVKITGACAPGLDVHGNRALVARALANLIDNALKYGAEGGVIVLEAEAVGAEVHICVADRAGGIPAARRDEALRKFGRLDAARSTPGTGLGLSLASAVASLHGGRLELEDNDPGLRARLILLRQSAPLPDQQGA